MPWQDRSLDVNGCCQSWAGIRNNEPLGSRSAEALEELFQMPTQRTQ